MGIAISCEQFRLLWRARLAAFDIRRNKNLPDSFADFNQLRRASVRVHFQLAPLGPLIGLVVVIHVAKQQTAGGLVHDQANVAADTHRPEARVFGAIKLVKAVPLAAGVQLQLKGGGLGQLLLFARQARQAGGEGVGDAEVHQTVSVNKASK